MNNNRFNVPSYMGQQPERFSQQGHGGGCRVGHFSPSQSSHYSPVSAPINRATPTPAPVEAPKQVDPNPCKSKPGTVVTGTVSGAITGAMAGSRAGPWGTLTGIFYGATSGAATGMYKDAYDIKECLDKKESAKKGPKP